MLEAFDLSNVGAALKRSFDLLNSNRINSTCDTFGQVRALESRTQISSSDDPILTLLDLHC